MSKMEKEPLFSAKNLKYLTGPFSANNPVIVQILGICSALAVTVQLKPAIVMALSVTVVTAFSNLVMSLLRNGVPSRIRIIVQLVVIAALVILVDQVLKAFVYEVSKQHIMTPNRWKLPIHSDTDSPILLLHTAICRFPTQIQQKKILSLFL